MSTSPIVQLIVPPARIFFSSCSFLHSSNVGKMYKMRVWLRDLQRGIGSRFTFLPSKVPRWSPDGSTLVFATLRNDGLLDRGERPTNMSEGEAFMPSEFNQSQGQFSSDGKWMAYVSDESGVPKICVTSSPTASGIRQISTAGGNQPRWRRDSKELFYAALDRHLMAVPVKAGGRFEAEAPQALFETALPFAPLRQAYSVSTDGQWLLLATPAEIASPSMTLVQNWQAELKK